MGRSNIELQSLMEKDLGFAQLERERDDAPLARWLSRKKGQHLWSRRGVGWEVAIGAVTKTFHVSPARLFKITAAKTVASNQ